MKKVLLSCVTFLLFLVGCNISPSLDGQYIKIKDNDRGSSLNVLNMNLVKEVNFGNNMCRFDYFGTTMSGQYKIDGNYVYIQVGGELGTLAMEIIDKETLEGEGWISGTFKKINSFKAKNLPAIGYYKTKSELNVRTGPGTDYFKIETISADTKVKVVKEIGEWCEIENDGYRGFVSKEFLIKE
jgi:Bacterial SH3 domain.